MPPVTALRPPADRLGRGWYVAAVLSAVLALGMCLLGWRQADQADRITADPVRVQGTVTQLPGGSGTYSEVGYTAEGRRLSAADLWLPAGARLGDTVCLEHAADDPTAVRVCGNRYPQPVGITLARTVVPAALLCLALCLFRILRHRRANPVRTARTGAGSGLVLTAVGMPALTHGKRSRRRRGGRRAKP